MPLIKFTAADVLRNKVLDAGWFGAEIVKVNDWKASKDGESQNLLVTFRIDKTDGKEIEINFNSKQLNRLIPLCSAATLQEFKPEDFVFNTDDLFGKKVDVEVVHKEYQGNIGNDIKNYLPYGKAASAPSY